MADDHAILDEYADGGNRQGLEELIQRYEPLVRAAALRQVGDPHLAQDITQTTMMTLVRKAGRIRRQQPIGPWLLRVTHDLAIDAIRSENARRRHERLAALYRGRQWYAGDSQFHCDEHLVDTALHALNRRDRTILVLRYLQEWPVSRIAAELEITEDAARQRLSRAVVRLREVLARQGRRREDLVPALFALRFRRLLQRARNSIPIRVVGTVVLISAGIVAVRVSMHRAMTNPPAVVQTTPPPTGRAQSTVP